MLGPNGAGKTTLLRILATLLRPSGGEVRALGCSLPDEAWKLRGRIGFLGHEPLLYRDLSGRENLRFHARLHGLHGRGRRGADRASCSPRSAMERRAEQRVAELSAGMRQRLAIAAASCTEPELLLLDEPDSNLDAEGRELARALIGPGAGRTRVIVSHDPERFEAEADQVLRLEAGGRAVAGMTPSRTAFATILAKDLRAELRTLQSLPAMALFATTTFVIFRFGLDRTTLSGSLAAGVLWATLLFAALLGVNRLFVAEREEGGFDAIRLAPIDRSALFAAKATALFAYLLVLELVVVPIFALFFLGSAAALGPLARRAAARRPRHRRHRHADLLDGGPLARPRPARAARPAAPRRAADDRRHGRQRAAAGRGRTRLPPLRHLAGGALPIRSDLPPARLGRLRFPPGGLAGRPPPTAQT